MALLEKPNPALLRHPANQRAQKELRQRKLEHLADPNLLPVWNLARLALELDLLQEDYQNQHQELLEEVLYRPPDSLKGQQKLLEGWEEGSEEWSPREFLKLLRDLAEQLR